MKENYEVCIAGRKCVLVPYRPEHVQKYHEWMKSPDLLEATGSEPLSLEEEVSMQQSWKDDPTKCTFIVLAKESCDSNSMSSSDDGSTRSIHDGDDTFVTRNLNAMVGDVNLFIGEEEEEYHSDEDDQEIPNDTDNGGEASQGPLQAEVDIMIAEQLFRGKGIGKEATCLMMQYGAKHLNIRRFYCKINEDNAPSISLFQSMGFVQCNYAACFKQVELELKCETSVEMANHIDTQLLEGHAHAVQYLSCPLKATKSTNATIADPVSAAAEALQGADYVLLLAGAGFSADSGLATYETMPDEYKDFCDPLMLVKDPTRFQKFWLSFAEKYSKSTPHEGYAILDKWLGGGQLPQLQKETERESSSSSIPTNTNSAKWWVYTSNVDGHFHRYKSFQNQLCEIHGNANEFRCACAMGLDNGFPRKGDIWQKWNEQVTKGPTKTGNCNGQECAMQIERVGNDNVCNNTAETENEKRQPQQQMLTCAICGIPSRPNVLMFHDTDSNVLRSIKEHRDRYQAWEAQMEDDVVQNGKNLVIVEVGCGMNVPAVRQESEEVLTDCLERIRATNREASSEESTSSNVNLVRINPKDAGIDVRATDVGHHVISIYDTSLQALCAIDKCLHEIQNAT